MASIEGRGSRASFNHSCVKTPLHPISGMPSPGYERRQLIPTSVMPTNRASNRASRASSASGPRSRVSSAQQQRPSSSTRRREGCNKQDDAMSVSLGPLLSFYESIPDYSELGHLPDREFYAKVRELRETQRAHVTHLSTQVQQTTPCQDPQRWTAGVQGVRCVLNESRGATPVPCSPSNSSARSQHLAWGRLGSAASPLVSPPSRPVSSKQSLTRLKERPRAAGAGRPPPAPRVSSARRSRVSSLWDEEDESWEEALMLLSEDEAEDTRGPQQQHQRLHKNVAWREPQFTVPKPFEMTRREEEERYYELLRRELLRDHGEARMSNAAARTPSPPRRSHEVPLTSRLPLFHGILFQQELRREKEKRRSKAKLLSQVRPFSFDLDDESPAMRFARMRTKLWQSSPELRDLSRIRGGGEFRAKPMPHHLYNADAFMKHQEEQFLRQLRRRVRAEETLRDSSLPPSMAARALLPHPPCTPATSASPTHHERPRRQHSAPLSKSSGSRRRSSPGEFVASPECHRLGGCSPYEVAFSNEEPRRRRPHSGSVSPIRHNLAAVLRIESCRRRAEREAAIRLEQRRTMEEARTRARVLRRRPAWRHMQQASTRRDLAIRTAARREEEHSRQQEHARFMGNMMGRVLGIPTLFERQAMQSARLRANIEMTTRSLQKQQQQFQQQQEQHSLTATRACRSPPSARKFVAPPVETHISFCPGTRNGEGLSEGSGDEKRDEPEFAEKTDVEQEKRASEDRDADTPCTEPVT